MNKSRVLVKINNINAGYLEKEANKFKFWYTNEYLSLENAKAVSLTLPLTDKTYESEILFPFFDGLAQEGWLKEMSNKILHIDKNDKYLLLVKNGEDCIGNVSFEYINE